MRKTFAELIVVFQQQEAHDETKRRYWEIYWPRYFLSFFSSSLQTLPQPLSLVKNLARKRTQAIFPQCGPHVSSDQERMIRSSSLVLIPSTQYLTVSRVGRGGRGEGDGGSRTPLCKPAIHTF